jgi:SAM-dependent methyltransferase
MTTGRLDDVLDRYYAEHYDAVVHGGIGGRIQDAFHAAVERPQGPDQHVGTVLEVGATSGEHLKFVRHRFDRYVMLDIRDSSAARDTATVHAGLRGAEVEFVVGDAQELAGIQDESVDRLVSMCLLHHLDDPRGSLKHWRRVVKPGGRLSLFVPCDPGLLWRSGRALTTFRAARAKGYSAMEIRFISACDHRNHVASLRWMIEGTFADDELLVRKYPWRVGSWNANLFYTFQIRKRHAITEPGSTDGAGTN